MEHIVEGQNTTLTCIGVGHPPPLVQWRKLNGSLSDRVTSTNMSMSTNEGNVTRVTVDLIFTGTYREDTGVYVCSATNLLNVATRNASLIVQCMNLKEHFRIPIIINQHNYVIYVTGPVKINHVSASYIIMNISNSKWNITHSVSFKRFSITFCMCGRTSVSYYKRIISYEKRKVKK